MECGGTPPLCSSATPYSRFEPSRTSFSIFTLPPLLSLRRHSEERSDEESAFSSYGVRWSAPRTEGASQVAGKVSLGDQPSPPNYTRTRRLPAVARRFAFPQTAPRNAVTPHRRGPFVLPHRVVLRRGFLVAQALSLCAFAYVAAGRPLPTRQPSLCGSRLQPRHQNVRDFFLSRTVRATQPSGHGFSRAADDRALITSSRARKTGPPGPRQKGPPGPRSGEPGRSVSLGDRSVTALPSHPSARLFVCSIPII